MDKNKLLQIAIDNNEQKYIGTDYIEQELMSWNRKRQ